MPADLCRKADTAARLNLPTRRLLAHQQAAEYCGMSVPHFDAHVAPHVPALDFGRKLLWDKKAIDLWLDWRSGIGQASTGYDDNLWRTAMDNL